MITRHDREWQPNERVTGRCTTHANHAMSWMDVFYFKHRRSRARFLQVAARQHVYVQTHCAPAEQKQPLSLHKHAHPHPVTRVPYKRMAPNTNDCISCSGYGKGDPSLSGQYCHVVCRGRLLRSPTVVRWVRLCCSKQTMGLR